MLLKLPDILILLLIFQLLFSSIYLFSKKSGKVASNILLGLFFLAICFSMTDDLLLRTGFYYHYPAFATFSSTFPFLYGPLLFLYAQSLIYKQFTFGFKQIVHFIPFFSLFIILFLSYELRTENEKIVILHNINGHLISAYLYIAALLMIIHFSVYAVSALLLIKKYKSLSLDKFSNTKKINLDWLTSTIVFFLILFILSLVNNIFEILYFSEFYTVSVFLIVLLLFYFINRFILKALHNPEYFSWVDEGEKPVKIKTQTLLVNIDKSEELNILAEFMQKNKPYLNPDLTIEMLANAMKMNPKNVSKLINENLKQNFFDFINRYRINEARNLLINSPDKKTTILEILYKTGFNSKSSFNTLFKKYTGVTPTEFKNQNSNYNVSSG